MEFVVRFTATENTKTTLTTIRKLAQAKTDVYHVKDASDSQEYAVKSFFQDECSFKRYRREKNMICTLDHPNIIKYHPIVEHNSDSDLIITEYLPNGDLLTLITKGGLNHEVHMRTYFHQLITGLEYMHSMNVAHLDLKLENLVLDKNFRLKIIDFDQSHYKNEQIGSAGTSGYRPPEIKGKKCNDAFAVDVYSAGIILYAFKARKFPFIEVEENGQTKVLSYDLFIDNNEEFWRTKAEKDGQKEDFFSEEFKALLRGMLERDPAKRMTIQQIKASSWYNKPVLTQESLEAYMNQFLRAKNRSPSVDTPKTFKPSSFPGIASPKASNINLNLWKCSTPKATKENVQKKQIDEGSDVTKSDDSTKVERKNSFDLRLWNLISPKASKKDSTSNKPSFLGSSGITDEPPRKSSFNLRFWNNSNNSSSKTDNNAKPLQVNEDHLNQNSNLKMNIPKRTCGVEAAERNQGIGQKTVHSNQRRPVRLTHLG